MILEYLCLDTLEILALVIVAMINYCLGINMYYFQSLIEVQSLKLIAVWKLIRYSH